MIWTALLILPIKVYRLLRQGFPKVCRFYPSCSAYAMEAIKTHGPWHGLKLTSLRLCRCHPFHPGGLDPVPDSLSFSPTANLTS